MALADIDEYNKLVESPYQRYNFAKNAVTHGVNRLLWSHWTNTIFGGSTPTTAATLDRTTAGTGDLLERYNPSASLYIAKAEFGSNMIDTGVWILCDRLSHQGGLSGTTTGAQTTNLPTAALTRYTSGAGVFAALEIYSNVGTTATTFTCSYTNQAGTAGRTSLAQVFGATLNREQFRLIPIDLQQGDTGVRSVESVTLAASTLTAGNFGVTLYKPLAMFPAFPQLATEWNAMFGGGGNLAEIIDGAALCWLNAGFSTTSNGIATGQLRFIEA